MCHHLRHQVSSTWSSLSLLCWVIFGRSLYQWRFTNRKAKAPPQTYCSMCLIDPGVCLLNVRLFLLLVLLDHLSLPFSSKEKVVTQTKNAPPSFVHLSELGFNGFVLNGNPVCCVMVRNCVTQLKLYTLLLYASWVALYSVVCLSVRHR